MRKTNLVLATALQAMLTVQRPSRKTRTVSDAIYCGPIEELKGTDMRIIHKDKAGGVVCQLLFDCGGRKAGEVEHVVLHDLKNITVHDVDC